MLISWCNLSLVMSSWCSMREMDIILYRTQAYIFHCCISLSHLGNVVLTCEHWDEVQWCNMSIIASQITSYLIVCSTAHMADIKEKPKALHYWIFISGIHQQLLYFPHKGTLIWKLYVPTPWCCNVFGALWSKEWYNECCYIHRISFPTVTKCFILHI